MKTAAPRVFVIGGSRSEDSMEWHVMDALNAIGCVSTLFDMRTLFQDWKFGDRLAQKAAFTFFREPERLRERKLIDAISDFEPDLVLVIIAKLLTPWTVDKIKSRTEAPVVSWFQDSLVQLGRQHMLGAAYDAVFVKDVYMRDLFANMLAYTRFYYLPEACNPRVHKPVIISEEDRRKYSCEIMIAGSLYYYRQEILRRLDKFDLRNWGGKTGHDWMMLKVRKERLLRSVIGNEKAKAVAAAQLVLNPLHFGEINSLNCRAFEMAGCGVCQLVSAKPILSEHFQIGKEVVAFDSVADLVDKATYYLQHPDEAAEIGRSATMRAHRDHTYEVRLAEIFRIVMGARPAAPEVGQVGRIQSQAD